MIQKQKGVFQERCRGAGGGAPEAMRSSKFDSFSKEFDVVKHYSYLVNCGS